MVCKTASAISWASAVDERTMTVRSAHPGEIQTPDFFERSVHQLVHPTLRPLWIAGEAPLERLEELLVNGNRLSGHPLTVFHRISFPRIGTQWAPARLHPRL